MPKEIINSIYEIKRFSSDPDPFCSALEVSYLNKSLSVHTFHQISHKYVIYEHT